MGKKGDKGDRTARARTRAFKRDDRQHGSPIPLESCSWCGDQFHSEFIHAGSGMKTTQLTCRIVCCQPAVLNSRATIWLPIVGVDRADSLAACSTFTDRHGG